MEETQKVSQDSSTPTKATTNIKTEQGIKNLIFGSISETTGKLVEYPFDTVKTRLQSQPSDRKLFNGPLDCFKKTISKDGFLGLYWGLSSPMVGAILENAILFLAYNHIQMLIREHTTPIDQKHLLYDNNYQKDAGQIPLSMTQLILAGPLSIIKYTLKTHGIKGFYCGHFGTFIQETFGGGAWFGTYEYATRLFIKRKEHSLLHAADNSNSITELMLSGALAGMAYNLLIFPADSIKSQMQTEE
ncbi:6058_t:CDS:2, partial [Entrophospora sp. SA101]